MIGEKLGHSRILNATVLLALAAVMPLATCQPNNEQSGDKYSDALLVVPGAQKVNFTRFQGSDQVTYTLSAPYPADEVISYISDELGAKGWEPLNYDLLNPGIPTSHVRGWTSFGDMTTTPHTVVYQWMAEWEDTLQDIVLFNLEYRWPKGGAADWQNLRVFGAYYPANIAEEMRKLAEEAASGCDRKCLPSEIEEYLENNFGEWRVVRLEDLLPEDKQLFLKQHPDDCPGFTSGAYRCSDSQSFAVVILSSDNPPRAKLLAFDHVGESYEATTLWEIPNVSNIPVVFTMPPGAYLSWERDEEVTTECPVIFYVHYEASAWMFYWSKGKWRELQISE